MELEDIKNLIREFGISQKAIASKMGMNENTFRLKLSDNFAQYSFTVNSDVNEIEKLRNVIQELSRKASLIA